MSNKNIIEWARRVHMVICLGLLGYLIQIYNLDFEPDEYTESNFVQFKSFKSLINDIRPVLEELMTTNYFKYFRVDLSKKCPYWRNEQVCRHRVYCEIKCPCPLDQLPETWIREDERLKYENNFVSFPLQDFAKPSKQSQPKGWELDQVTENSRYVNLNIDREMWTKYQGAAIWKAIYDVCFQISEQCLETNFLYRIISGMHASVSSHLTFYQPDIKLGLKQINTDIPMYFQMVGYHKDRLANLIFAIRFLLRALIRNSDFICNYQIDSGNFQEDVKAQQLIKQLCQIIQTEQDSEFKEMQIFKNTSNLQKEYLNYFKKITNIMDCVDCQKCKAYGKMQIIGIGVALRGLFNSEHFHITRNELIAFLNTMDKWIESTQIIDSIKIKVKAWKIRVLSSYGALFFAIPQIILTILLIIIDKKIINKKQE